MENGKGGMSFLGWLQILFIGLKLTDYIEWSWLWVLSPLWLTFIIIFFLALFAGLVKELR